MKLLVDVGNTAVKFASVKGSEFSYVSRIYNSEISQKRIESLLVNEQIDSIYISSVAPKVTEELCEIFFSLYSVKPVVIDISFNNKIKLNIDNEKELGIDLLCDLVAGKEKYHEKVAIVDFGTATKILFIDDKGEFSSCAIFSSIEQNEKILSSSTELLPLVKENKVKPISECHNTVDVISSSLYYSQVYTVKGLIKQYEKEVNYPVKVVLTGGNANKFLNEFKGDEYDPHLVLKGLSILIKEFR